jgi:hypothetical protein
MDDFGGCRLLLGRGPHLIGSSVLLYGSQNVCHSFLLVGVDKLNWLILGTLMTIVEF